MLWKQTCMNLQKDISIGKYILIILIKMAHSTDTGKINASLQQHCILFLLSEYSTEF